MVSTMTIHGRAVLTTVQVGNIGWIQSQYSMLEGIQQLLMYVLPWVYVKCLKISVLGKFLFYGMSHNDSTLGITSYGVCNIIEAIMGWPHEKYGLTSKRLK